MTRNRDRGGSMRSLIVVAGFALLSGLGLIVAETAKADPPGQPPHRHPQQGTACCRGPIRYRGARARRRFRVTACMAGKGYRASVEL